MKPSHLYLSLILFANISFAQVRNTTTTKMIQGEWFAAKTLIDPKVGTIKLIRVTLDSFGHGIFLSVKDSANFTLYYSPMCGNDCFWNYQGKYSLDKTKKLTLKFNTYTQHGFCKSMSKSYNKNQMQFFFTVEQKGKDTLVLKRQAK